MENLDLFADRLPVGDLRKSKAKPRVLMHVSDAGTREDGQHIFVMTCRRCGAATGWLPFASITAAKRGVPCQACNDFGNIGSRRSRRRATAALGSPAAPPSTVLDRIKADRTVFNAERTHRFTWFDYWGDIEDFACGISMNPSGAAEDVSDPTVDGMCRRAREHWGVGAYYQLNVMSVRGTYSADLAKAAVVNLPENDLWIRRIAAKARLVVVSWGNPGHKSGRGPAVEEILREICDPAKVFCFGRNLNGSPVHPLYQRLDAPLQSYFR